MAVFDIRQQRVCVRVVYDGAASAGKTTNVLQLAELFATQRTCELFSPGEMDGRTLYFDWLEIAAGMVCGFPLLCQVITVPGQLVLTARRRHLLATADVVVHVCDSDERAVGRAIEGLALFDEIERASPEGVPLVLQANKQDQARALPGAALVAALGRPPSPVVEAIASDGVGVVDTFVAAVRAVVRAIQARVEAGGVRIPVRLAETSGAVLERLSGEEVDPDWALEMMLEEASNAFVAGALLDADDAPHDAASAPGPGPGPGRAATLPTEHVPTGFIWPAHTGRAALRALAGEATMRRAVTLDGEGVARLVVGDFVLSTGSHRRFETSESARQALVRAARERTQLGSLLAPETVLVAQPAGDDASWLWTIVPRMPTVAQLAAAGDRADASRGGLLTSFGAALVDALKLEAQLAVELELSPHAFGLRHGAMRYLGEIVAAEGARRDPAAALARAIGALSPACDDVEPAVGAVETAIATRLSTDDVAKLSRAAATEGSTSAPDDTAARNRSGPRSSGQGGMNVTALLDEVDVGVLLTDASGRVSFANRFAGEVLLRQGELGGEDVQGLLGLDDRPERLLGALQARRWGHSLRVVDHQVELDLKVSRATEPGPGFCFVFHDRTLDKQLEAERRRFDHLAAMGTMVAGFAHEIRNPMASLRSLAEALGEELEEAGIDLPHVERMLKVLERVEGLVRSSLLFGRPSRPRAAAHRPGALLSAAVSAIHPRTRALGGELRVEVEPGLGDVFVDDGQVSQILVIFLNNALDATGSPARVVVRAGPARATTEGGKPRSDPPSTLQLRFDVSDDGPGVPPEHRERIFDPFFTTTAAGTGLGLAIAQQLAQENGARIELTSTLGGPTTFSLIVPLARSA